MGMCIVVNECDWEVRYHMAMKSSGLALLWKPHPSPSERQRVLRLRRKQILIDYDNHHLNQVPSAPFFSPAALLLHSLTSPTLIYSTSPQGILLSWQNTGASHLQNLHPLNHTYSHTHECTMRTHEKATLSISYTHRTKRTDIATCIMCVHSVRCFLLRGS